jgi:outer membrane protein assembly factor BamB
MYQMDALHTGRSPHTGPRRLTLQRSIALTAPELRPADAPAITTPDIQSSIVVGPTGTIYATTFSGWTYAVRDSPTASDRLELAWRFRPAEGGSPAHGTAAISPDGTVVYVGYGVGMAPNQKAVLYALRPPSSGQDAQIAWQADLGPGGAANSPTLTADGTVYYVTVQGLLSAIDNGGRVKWTAQIGTTGQTQFGQTVKVAPAVAPDGTVYIGAITGSLYAVAPPSGNGNQGSVKWSFDFGEHLGPTPLVSTPVTNGGNRGQDAIGSAASATIGPDGTIYIGANNSNFHAIDPSGRQKWMYEAERELAGIWTTAALSPDASVVYFGANKGGMYALNTRDGSLKWKAPVFGSIYSSPALDARGTLYTGSSIEHVFALDSSSGERVADYAAGAAVWTAPAIRPDGTLAVGDRTSRILVLGDA